MKPDAATLLHVERLRLVRPFHDEPEARSQQHIAAQAAATGATGLLSNHSEFDNAVNKNRMLAWRGDGPHPYEVGADWVGRYFQVMQHCARAAQLRLEQERPDLS